MEKASISSSEELDFVLAWNTITLILPHRFFLEELELTFFSLLLSASQCIVSRYRMIIRFPNERAKNEKSEGEQLYERIEPKTCGGVWWEQMV